MKIKIFDLGYNIRVVFEGAKEEYGSYFEYVINQEDATKDETKGWIIPKTCLEDIQSKFDTEIVKQPWDDIGKDMKLKPFPYQREVIYFAFNNPESLLILPPGRGKTPIGIGIYLELLNNKKTNKPAIVCTKASLKFQWVQEISKFSNLKAREIKTPSAMGKKFDEQFNNVDIFVLNYETLKNKEVCKAIKKKNPDTIIVDEIHYIGNRTAEKSKALHKFNKLKYKIGLTATPITKNPINLYSIFNFIKKDVFDKYSDFINNYIELDYYGNFKKCIDEEGLKEAIRPYTLVKDDAEIAKQLPKLQVSQIECEMTPQIAKATKKMFEIEEELKQKIYDYSVNFKGRKEDLFIDDTFILLNNKVMECIHFNQEIADDPYLIEKSTSKFKNEIKLSNKDCPKYNLLVSVIEDILSKNENEKICIFTKFKTMQIELAKRLEKQFTKISKNESYICKCALVNGDMNSQERYHQAYELFQNNDDYKFLIATDAMNEGVSLSKCSYLIEFDLSDSYAIQKQRHGRIVRADSVSRTSYVYQLILKNSWDERQLNIIKQKEGFNTTFVENLHDEED